MKLNLVTTTQATCSSCGYSRRLTPSEVELWQKGEHFSGSQECPACGGFGRVNNYTANDDESRRRIAELKKLTDRV